MDKKNTFFNINKLDLLISIYIFCIAVSELMGAKTFPLATIGTFKLNASVGIFVVPLIFTINDAITEVFGAERARSMVRSGLLVIFLFFLTSLFFTALPASTRFQTTEPAYDKIFSVSARIAISSLIAFTIAEFTDVAIFAKLRQKLGKKGLWLRNNVSNFISQFFDTACFMIFAFYAFDKSFSDNVAFLAGLIIPYWLLKCGMSVIETPLVYAVTAWLKGKESI
jgi:uncharacterized integral membrane protein (TIGR00697 family)